MNQKTYFAVAKYHATTISHSLMAERMNYAPDVDAATLIESAKAQGVDLYERNHMGLTQFVDRARAHGGIALDRALVIQQQENMG